MRHRRRGKPGRERAVEEEALALVQEEVEHVAGEVGQEEVGPPVVVEIGEVAAHAGDDAARLVRGDARFEGDLLESGGRVPRRRSRVAEQEVGHAVVRDEHVHASVAVVVGDRDSHALALVRREADLLRDVGKGAVAVVAQQRVWQRLKDARVAVDAVAGLAPPAPDVGLACEGPIEVVRDEEVEPAVVVVVEKRRARLQRVTRHGHARGGRNVLEPAVALVVIEHVVAVVGHEHVRVAVIVVVADRDALGVAADALAAQAGLRRDVDEPAGAGVVKEAVEGRRIAAQVIGRGRPVQEQQVDLAVAIIVERRHRSAQRLERVLHLRGEVLLGEAHATHRGFVHQHERGSRAGGRRHSVRAGPSRGCLHPAAAIQSRSDPALVQVIAPSLRAHLAFARRRSRGRQHARRQQQQQNRGMEV